MVRQPSGCSLNFVLSAAELEISGSVGMSYHCIKKNSVFHFWSQGWGKLVLGQLAAVLQIDRLLMFTKCFIPGEEHFKESLQTSHFLEYGLFLMCAIWSPKKAYNQIQMLV